MTNQEVIRLLSMGRLAYNEVEAKAFCEAYNMAIKVLEQEPCEDCISRSKVLEGKVIHQFCDGVEIIDSYAVPVEYIEQLPPVTPAEKVGHWIRGFGNTSCTCSECHGNGESCYRFCPHCGSKMMQEVEE